MMDLTNMVIDELQSMTRPLETRSRTNKSLAAVLPPVEVIRREFLKQDTFHTASSSRAFLPPLSPAWIPPPFPLSHLLCACCVTLARIILFCCLFPFSLSSTSFARIFSPHALPAHAPLACCAQSFEVREYDPAELLHIQRTGFQLTLDWRLRFDQGATQAGLKIDPRVPLKKRD